MLIPDNVMKLLLFQLTLPIRRRQNLRQKLVSHKESQILDHLLVQWLKINMCLLCLTSKYLMQIIIV